MKKTSLHFMQVETDVDKHPSNQGINSVGNQAI